MVQPPSCPSLSPCTALTFGSGHGIPPFPRFFEKDRLRAPRPAVLPSFGVLATCFAGLIALLSCIAMCGSALALSSTNVPLDHWSYGALDKLEGFGLVKSDIYSTRPYTRLEVARLVREALESERYKNKNLPPLINYLLEKFQYEFRTELAEVSNDSARRSFFLKPLEEAQANYVHVEGEPRRFTGAMYPYAAKLGFGINATEGTPLLPNNQGINYTPGNNFSLLLASSARLWDDVTLYAEPIIVMRENQLSWGQERGDAVQGDLHTGYVKLSPDNFEVEVGRDAMWWGQGYHGTLLLTDNAPPFDMVKFSNPNPSILPWFLGDLGLYKYSIFVARLEESRDFAHAVLTGARIVFKPDPVFEWGATGTLLLGGVGAAAASIPGGSGQENGEISFDARLRLPFLRNAELYAEYGGEDTQSVRWYEFIFRDVAYILGIYFPTVFNDGKTDLRIEYANNAFKQHLDSHVGFWYGHQVYTSGETFQGMIWGHPMGPDASDFLVRATHYVTDRLRIGVDYDNMERGLTLGYAVERVYSAGADLTYDINEWLSVCARYSYGPASNFDLVLGSDRTDQLFMTTLKVTF